MPQESDISPCSKFLYSFMGTGRKGAEIGVCCGGGAEVILNYLYPSKYYLIDPWAVTPFYAHVWTQEQHDTMYANVVARFASNPAVEILRMVSEEASKIVENDLDFVYVDGDHSYDMKMLDMELWYPKIRSGGVLCGDDYNLPDTRRVVKDFCDKYKLAFEISVPIERVNDPMLHPPEFWIVKP